MEYFSYRMNTRNHAKKMLVIALLTPVVILGMMIFFDDGTITQNNYLWAGFISFLIAIFIIVFFVIPDFKINLVFEYIVSDCFVECKNSGVIDYKIPLSEITGLKQVKYSSSDTSTDFIETLKGNYPIPKRYCLDIYEVKKSILKAKPEINTSNTVSY